MFVNQVIATRLKAVLWQLLTFASSCISAEVPPSPRKTTVHANVAFGGPDTKTLYITDSGSGHMLMARVPVAARALYPHM